MDTNQPTTATTYTTVTRPPGMFGSKVPSSVAFLVGILVFLLPFTEIRCGGTKIMTKSGLDYALGNDWKTVAGGLGKGDLQDKAMDTGKEQKGNTQYFIIGALALGALGFLLSMGSAKTAAGGIVTGVLAAGALIGFMLDLKKNFANSLRDQAIDKAAKGADDAGLDGVSNTMGDIKPTLAFSPWFYIAIVAFIVAAIFCYNRMRASRS
jgi:hypothetical protein